MQTEPLTIDINGYRFDPLTEDPKIPDELRYEEEPEAEAYYIVQFRRSLDREARARLQPRYRLTLDTYIPQFAYVERLDRKTLKALQADPLFRAVALYQPAFKLAPNIGETKFRTEERRKGGRWI